VGGCFGSALDQDGGVWVWGSNSHGELGLGREQDEEYEAKPFP
jgi:alpha-tubulin suppressor-like RCC1 family protein